MISNAINEMTENKSTETSESTVNLNQIVHQINPTFQGEFNYWHYNGSLTTPDCNEAVVWILAEKPLWVSTTQV